MQKEKILAILAKEANALYNSILIICLSIFFYNAYYVLIIYDFISLSYILLTIAMFFAAISIICLLSVRYLNLLSGFYALYEDNSCEKVDRINKSLTKVVLILTFMALVLETIFFLEIQISVFLTEAPKRMPF